MKALYFTEGFTPTESEAKEIKALEKAHDIHLHLRNARYVSAYEKCDRVAGKIPPEFKDVETLGKKDKKESGDGYAS